MSNWLIKVEEKLKIRDFLRFFIVFAERYSYPLVLIFFLIFFVGIIIGHNFFREIKTSNLRFFDYPGIFAIVTGLLTLLGLIVTISTVLSHFNRITNFRTLLIRLIKLLKEAIASDSYVCLVCFYPAFGCATLLSDKIFINYKKGLEEAAALIPVIVLNARSEKWEQVITSLCKFYGKSDDQTLKAIQKNQEILDVIDKNFKGIENIFLEKHVPDFHLIFSEKRGILFTPYFLPTELNTTDIENKHPNPIDSSSELINKVEADRAAQYSSRSRSPAEIIGVEVMDPNIIDQFIRCFDHYNTKEKPLVEIIKELYESKN